MKLNLYNTLSGAKEEFKPIKAGVVGMYHCGPTVYNFAHIGNLRSYVFADTLRRTLEYAGFRVRQVMNITDIGHLTSDADEGDDKMVRALKREGRPMTLEGLRDVAEKYTNAFIEDLKSLNIKLPHDMPKASEHIAEDIALIGTLEEKDIAYRTHDGIYFDISKFPDYGTRGGFALGDLKEGARVVVNREKRSARDFALWKFSKSGIGWESPWGRGFPGWHIECFAMSRKYLAQPFDIHTGGVDHVATHHQNEIAQSEAAYGAPLANYWLHNEHMQLGSEKMAKSGENFITLQTLANRGIHPLAFRYYLLQSHYRSPLHFSWDALEAAQSALEKLLFSIWSFSRNSFIKPGIPYTQSVCSYAKQLTQASHDDLNTPTMVSILNKLIHDVPAKPKEKLTVLFEDVDFLLGLRLKELSEKIVDIPGEVAELVSEHDTARKAKDWQRSGILRDEILKRGYRVQNLSDAQASLVTRKLSSLL